MLILSRPSGLCYWIGARAAWATPLMTRITSATRALPLGHLLECQAGKFVAA